MGEYDHYSSQAPRAGKTSPCVLHGLRNPDGSHPVVHLELLGEENKTYHLEMLAKAGTRIRSAAAASTPAETDRQNREERAENRELLIAHSARRIEHVLRRDGSRADEISRDEIARFVRAIPDRDFETLWNHSHNPFNYRDVPIVGDQQAAAEK